MSEKEYKITLSKKTAKRGLVIFKVKIERRNTASRSRDGRRG